MRSPQQRDTRVYAHLAAFMRGGDAAEIDALWKLVGHEMVRKNELLIDLPG